MIGGDGSLSRRRPAAPRNGRRWSPNCSRTATIDQETADRHPALMIAGLVGSIDNDMIGTDMTIGADSALHRIVEAIDSIASTAASHQRSFVVEVMGRHCGYLALMSAIAGGADYVLHPGEPARPGLGGPPVPAAQATGGRPAGGTASWSSPRAPSDSENTPINSDYVRQVLEDRLGEDTRVTILGHVQRGGAPSAFDRSMSSHARLRRRRGGAGRDRRTACPQLIGMQDNRVAKAPLMESVAKTRELAEPDRRQGLRHRADDARRQLHRDARTSSTPSRTPCPARPAKDQVQPDRGRSTSVAWRPG